MATGSPITPHENASFFLLRFTQKRHCEFTLQGELSLKLRVAGRLMIRGMLRRIKNTSYSADELVLDPVASSLF